MPDLHANEGSDSLVCHSPALLAAQQRLDQLRRERLPSPRRMPSLCQRRPSEPGAPQQVGNDRPTKLPDLSVAVENQRSSRAPADEVRLRLALALAMLEHEVVATGRVWLLLKAIDEEGRGWLPEDRVRDHLASEGSPYRLCGRRQLRNLLNQGQDIFWTRQPSRSGSPGRIWLRSPSRVAAALGLDYLSGRMVALPLPELLAGVGRVRASFYAAFHASRQGKDYFGPPISRAQVAAVTKVPERTQRHYDTIAGIKKRVNYAVGERFSDEVLQEMAWQHGRSVFRLVDYKGCQGPKGRSYVAWRLPNGYAVDTDRIRSSKRKRFKKKPVDLVTSGAQGNDRSKDCRSGHPKNLFHTDGKSAGKTYNRNPFNDAYWPAPGKILASSTNRPAIWHVLSAASQQRNLSVVQRGGNLLPGL